MTTADDHIKLLKECIVEWERKVDATEGETEGRHWYEPFVSMLEGLEKGRRAHLTERQLAWVRGVHDDLFDSPDYTNDWSAGRVPRGREVETPTVLKVLPLKPPGRP